MSLRFMAFHVVTLRSCRTSLARGRVGSGRSSGGGIDLVGRGKEMVNLTLLKHPSSQHLGVDCKLRAGGDILSFDREMWKRKQSLESRWSS